jgi:serine palmitoyltransferase
VWCRLREMGVVTFGHAESPVVPMLVYTFSKMAATVERLVARGIAVVGVGFPATPLNKARIRSVRFFYSHFLY